eukprot:9770078-Karenia_brevis.AAC.1
MLCASVCLPRSCLAYCPRCPQKSIGDMLCDRIPPPLQPRLTLPDISSPARSHLPWLEPALSPPSAMDAALATRSLVPEHE